MKPFEPEIHICKFKHGKLVDALYNARFKTFRCRRCFNIVPLNQVSSKLLNQVSSKLHPREK